MRLPGPKDVPFTAAISGLVFLIAFMNLGEPIHLVYVLAGWGVVYLAEWGVRAVIRSQRSRRRRDEPAADRQHEATTGAGT